MCMCFMCVSQQKSAVSTFHSPHVCKLLFSATMTLDPEHLSPLHLHNPIIYTTSLPSSSSSLSSSLPSSLPSPFAEGVVRYSLPPQLRESAIACTRGEKPLVVVHLVVCGGVVGGGGGGGGGGGEGGGEGEGEGGREMEGEGEGKWVSVKGGDG